MKRKISPHTARRLSRVQRLRFILRFVQMDLSALRPGDWLNLRDDCARVLVGVEHGPEFDFGTDVIPIPDGFVAHIVEPPYLEEASGEVFAQLQAETRAIVEDMVLGARGRQAPCVHPIPLLVALRSTRISGQGAGAGLSCLIAEGALRDVFLWLTFMLLHEGAASVARCPECTTIFARNRNQEYCSRSCTNRVSQRLWHERHVTATPA